VIKDFILKNTIFKKRLNLIEKKRELYAQIIKEEDIYNYQLNKFNEVWQNAYENIPFYKMWKEKYNLPYKIESIEELKNFPVLSKKDIQQNYNLIFDHLSDYKVVSTGGTSGAVTKFPTNSKIQDENYALNYLGRGWWNIKPLDQILMFWGHSHLFGKGYKRYINKIKRKLADFMINTYRISSYDLTVKNINKFYKKIIEIRPKVIISYSSNISKLSKYIYDNKLEFSKVPNVIITSDSVSEAEIKMIKDVFCDNLINEYGMAETGVIAYSYKSHDNIRVFWDSFILTVNNDNELFITSFANSLFPLINYSTEDKIVPKKIYKNSILNIKSIIGKKRESVHLKTVEGDMVEISLVLFDHILKCYPNIYSVSYEVLDNGLNIYVLSDRSLDISILKEYLISEMHKEDEFKSIDFNNINIYQTHKEMRTIAGKNQRLYKT